MREKCQVQCSCNERKVNDMMEYIRSLSHEDQVIILQKLMDLLGYKDTNVQ